MNAVGSKRGFAGTKAPPWLVKQWVDEDGQCRDPVQLSDFAGKWKVVYCFQSWCPGCHSHGVPALRQMVEALEGNGEVAFVAVQTVFEGFETNDYDAMLKFQKDAALSIPFGHDPGDASTGNRSSMMYHYRSGGTPWFIVIDPNDQVVFSEFRIDADQAVEFFNKETLGRANEA